EVLHRCGLETGGEEARLATMGHVKKRIPVEAAHVKRVASPVSTDHPELRQKRFHLVEIRRLEPYVCDILNLDSHEFTPHSRGRIASIASRMMRSASALLRPSP